MISWPTIGAANNADWCGLVCRTHGIASEFNEEAWTAPTRLPPLYPDAVTLAPRTELLGQQSVRVLAAREGDRIVGGAVLNHRDAVVGISNFFAESRRAAESWKGCLALAQTLFPGETLIGYESGDTLDALQRQGFEAAGPLRVWLSQD